MNFIPTVIISIYKYYLFMRITENYKKKIPITPEFERKR